MASPCRDPVPADSQPARGTGESYVEQLGFWCAVFVLAHVVSKPITPRSTVRLLCTVAYFAALLRLCLLAMHPRCQFLKRAYEWKYEDCPQHLERAWRRWLHEVDRVVTTVGFHVIVLVTCCGLETMNYWFAGLDDLAPLYRLGWWLSVIGLVAYLASSSFHDAWHARRALGRQLAACEGQGYQPKPWSEYWAPTTLPSEPVAVLGPETFSAGGIDWQWGDFTPNCVVFGQTKAGKTSCVLNALLDGILGSGAAAKYPPGALIMDPKGDFLDKIQSVCRRWGRERDVMILDPDLDATHPTVRWNPLDSLDDEFELAARCGTVMEMLGMRETQSTYWIDSARQFIAHAITLLRQTDSGDEPPSFAAISRLATHRDELMERLAQLDDREPDGKTRACRDYFSSVWFVLDDKLRTDVMTFIRIMLNPFQREPYATLFSGRSTLSIAQMIDRGAIFYLHLPLARQPALARAIGTFVKLEYFQEIRRRLNKPRPSFLLCDEFSEFVSFGEGQPDASFFAMSRQSNHANIVAVQNIHSLLMHSHEESPVFNLLGNCAVKIFLRNTDPKTNEYGSELHGQELVEAQSITHGGAGRGRMGRSGTSIAGSDQFSLVVRPEFFTRLRVPGDRPDTLFTESVVHLGSRHNVVKRALKTRWWVHPL